LLATKTSCDNFSPTRVSAGCGPARRYNTTICSRAE